MWVPAASHGGWWWLVGTMCACGPAQVLVPHHLLQGPPPSAVCYLVRFKFATFHPDEDYLGVLAPVPTNTDLIAVGSWQILNQGPIYDPRMNGIFGQVSTAKTFRFFPQRGRGGGGGLWADPHAPRYLPILREPLPTNIEYLSLVPLGLHIWIY